MASFADSFNEEGSMPGFMRPRKDSKEPSNSNSSFNQNRKRRQSLLGSGGLRGLRQGTGLLSKQAQKVRSGGRDGKRDTMSDDSAADSYHKEQQRIKNEQMLKKRSQTLYNAFIKLGSRVRQEADRIDDLVMRTSIIQKERGQQEIQNLSLVKMFAQFEEYSEFENIFAGNMRAERASKELIKKFQDLVSDCFSEVQFVKDYQEASSWSSKAFDSDDDALETQEQTRPGVQLVSTDQILFCNEFHETLESCRQVDKYSSLRHLFDSNDYPGQESNSHLQKVESNVQLQANLMIQIIKRIQKTLHSQLNGETDIVQCFLLEIKDIKEMSSKVDFGELKRVHRECYLELQRLVQQLQIDRFMVFLLEYKPQELQKLSRKKKYDEQNESVHDFELRFCTKMLKRTCKFILAFNYLLVHRKMNMLAEVGAHLKIFISETCDLLIEKLSNLHRELEHYLKKTCKELDVVTQREKCSKNDLVDGFDQTTSCQPSLLNSAADSKTMSATQLHPSRPPQRQRQVKQQTLNKRNSVIESSEQVNRRVNKIEIKIKNTKRAINITKTLFGMVDEMDSTDLCSQKDKSQVALMADAQEKADKNQTDLSETQLDKSQQRSEDIVDLVSKIEQEMALFKYSKLKQDKTKAPKPFNFGSHYGGLPHLHEDVNDLQDSAQFEESDMSSSTLMDVASSHMRSLVHAPEHINVQDLERFGVRSRDESPDDIFSKFVDPFKYHEMAREAAEKEKSGANVEDFMAYQEGDKLTKRSPAVTFGKGMRKPPQNGIAVEESPSIPVANGQAGQDTLVQDGFDLDLTRIQHQHTASEVNIKDLISKDRAFFSLNDEEDQKSSRFVNQASMHTPKEEDFINSMVQQYRRDVGGQFVSQNRFEMFLRQVLPREKLQEIIALQESKRNNFQEILSNLLFSANNPFQAEIDQVHDLNFQQKTEARMKHDFNVSGSLAYIFHSKHLTFKTMLQHLTQDESQRREGGATGIEPKLDADRSQAADESGLDDEGNQSYGFDRSTADEKVRPIKRSQMQQIKDNYRFAMSKQSRFLDTSLKVSEYEHRENIFDNEIDEFILQDESIINQEEDQIYDSVKDKNMRMDEGEVSKAKPPTQADNEDSGLDSELYNSNPGHRKKRKTRRQLNKEQQRISKLLQMHTSDLKFYRASANTVVTNDEQKRSSRMMLSAATNLVGQSYTSEESVRVRARDLALREMELGQAKFLLMRLRNDEIQLHMGNFQNEKKGLEQASMFEANSSQHYLSVLKEQDALRGVIKQLTDQYSRQLSYRDPNLQEMIDGGTVVSGEQESFIEVNNNELDQLQREYEQRSRVSSDKQLKQQQAMQRLNFQNSQRPSAEQHSGNRQPISMLEMAFNEINPYRETKLAAQNLLSYDSVNVISGAKSYGIDESVQGGSVQVVGKQDMQLSNVEKSEDNYGSDRQRALETSLGMGHEIMPERQVGFKMRASEYIQQKRPQIGAILNQSSKQSISLGDAKKFVSNESTDPKEITNQTSVDQSLDPAYVMGFGGRKPRVESLLEDSALLQFQEITGWKNGPEQVYQQSSSAAGFGLGGANQDSSQGRDVTNTFTSSLGGAVMETPNTKVRGEEEFKVEDLEGVYTPEFQETIKKAILKRQRTQTVQ